MTDTYRKDRIERLLHELKYEITRGIVERDIEEQFHFQWMFPSMADSSKVVCCHFSIERRYHHDIPPLLHAVKGGK